MTIVCWATANPDAGERGAWDMGIVEELTAGPEYEYRLPDLIEQSTWAGRVLAHWLQPSWGSDGAVVVVAGQHNATPEYANAIAGFVGTLPWALVIVTSDEEALFPIDALPRGAQHETWVQYHAREGAARVIPIGCPPNTPIGWDDDQRDTAVMFAGQDTHERRHELLDVLKGMASDYKRFGDIGWIATTGFTQGLDRGRYMEALQRTRIAPCPSGPHSLDSFRLYEALAAGCLPVIETHTPHGDEIPFWDALFGDSWPIPLVDSWRELPLIARGYADVGRWREDRDRIQAWWAAYREDLEIDFANTVKRLRQS